MSFIIFMGQMKFTSSLPVLTPVVMDDPVTLVTSIKAHLYTLHLCYCVCMVGLGTCKVTYISTCIYIIY